MIGIMSGSTMGSRKKYTGFVMLSHELRSRLKDFTPSEWMVLTCIALHADQNGLCCPSVSLIAQETGMSERLVQQAIKSLSTGEIRGYTVLSCRARHTASGRQTSNIYELLPTGFGEGAESAPGEGAKIDRGEGAEIDPLITLKNIQKEEYTPIVPKRGTKRNSIKMPVDDDPAKALFLAYRREVFTDPLFHTAFMLGEWRNSHHVLRSMQAANITPEQVEHATRNLVAKWGGRRDMVTINALWKHWSTATEVQVKQNTLESAMTQADRLWRD